MAQRKSNDTYVDYKEIERRRALKIQREISKKNNKKIPIHIKKGTKSITVYLTFDQLKESKEEAQKKGMNLNEFYLDKFSVYNKFNKKQEVDKPISYPIFKKDLLQAIKKMGVTLDFLQTSFNIRRRREEKKKQMEVLVKLKKKFMDVKRIANATGVSYHIIYRAKLI